MITDRTVKYSAIWFSVYLCFIPLYVGTVEIWSNSKSLEMLLYRVFLISSIIIGNLSIYLFFIRRNLSAFLFSLIVCILTGSAIYSVVNRNFEVERRYWNIDGIVKEKYRDLDNRGARAMIVNGEKFEHVPKFIWDKVDIGNRLSLKECSNSFTVNGNRIENQ